MNEKPWLLHHFEEQLAGQRIFITGHTGFTGSWVSAWLLQIGATLAGYALPPDTTPSMFHDLNLSDEMISIEGDICDYEHLLTAINDFKPDLILHLAAQPLVRRSYREPVYTFNVNTQGTAHVLEAARSQPSVRGLLCITTDKVYQNHGGSKPFKENDNLGGKDPYSASKAAAEMLIQSYMHSYPHHEGKGPAIATARGGNIIGGGDWSEDRLIPDFVRAIIHQQPLTLRYPQATRPWQHVLALAHGYLLILAKLISTDAQNAARAWNFGPQNQKEYTVQDLLEALCEYWERPRLTYLNNPLPEADKLALDSSLARNQLKWHPVWNTEQVIKKTADWYREYYHHPKEARNITMKQIQEWRTGMTS